MKEINPVELLKKSKEVKSICGGWFLDFSKTLEEQHDILRRYDANRVY
jgi:hypothetical protein